MQKTKRTLKILVAVLVVIVALAIVIALVNAQRAKQKAEEDAASVLYLGQLSDPVYLAFNAGRASEVSEFVLEDEVWYWDGDRELPLKQDRLTGIAETVPELTAVRKLEISEDLSYYGLAEPAYTFTARDAAGKQLELLIGNQLEEDRYYVMEPGGDAIYTIEEDLPETLASPLYAMTEIEEFDTITESMMLSYTITGSDGTELYFEKETAADQDGKETYRWKYRTDSGLVYAEDYAVKTADGKDVTAQTLVAAIVKNFERAFFYSCKGFNCSQAELAGYGMDNPMKVTLVYTGQTEDKQPVEKSLSFLFGDQFTETDENYGEEDYNYAMMEGSKMLCCMTARRVAPFADALDALAAG